MGKLELEKIVKLYPAEAEPAVKGVDLSVADREFVVLVGPSGCGKSTILRMIAGLVGVSGGRILIEGRDVTELPPKDRDIAMVFQNYALFPHMDVYANIAFGMMIRGTPKAEIDRAVREAAEVLELQSLLKKKPGELSGGQRQRVAVGRAIVRRPKAFLFDEPLSNLDAKLRTQMRSEIMRLHRKLGATSVYVTHDQAEAMTMADRIVVLQNGVVQQVGSPITVYCEPRNTFVAGFIGSPPMNIFKAQKEEKDGRLFLRVGPLLVELPEALTKRLSEDRGKSHQLGIRPEDIYLQDRKPAGISTGAPFDCEVDLAESLGNEVCLHCRAGELTFQTTQKHDSKVRAGGTLKLAFALDKLHVFDEKGERLG